MRFSILITALALLSFGCAHHPTAEDNSLDQDFLRGFMVGEYDLVGRKPDSTTVYTGHVSLRDEANTLYVTRTIDGQTTKTTLEFATVGGGDHIPVARSRFIQDGVEHEATYMWHSDADNYPRITGYTYRHENKTKSPGLEALFRVAKGCIQ